MTKGFTAFIVIVNIIMSLLLVLISEIVLIGLQGQALTVNIFTIEHQPIGNPPIPTVAPDLPNFPVFIFIFDLIVNVYFIFRLQRSKETKPNT